MSEQEAVYICTKCDELFRPESEIRFCSQCGAPVVMVEGGRPKRVLLVDDSALARTKFRVILKSLGCQVFEAEDGMAGLKAAGAVEPDLIILDIEMPQMGGLQMLGVLRKEERFASTPVVILTGQADIGVVSQALTAGATNYLLKDTPVPEILNRLKQSLNEL